MTRDPFARVRDEFDVRFYRWALEDARREMREGLPLLRAIRGHAVLEFLAHMALLPAADQRRLAVALVKRWHENAVRVTGETITADEAELMQAWMDLDPLIDLPEEERYLQLRLTDPSRVRVNRGRLLARVKAALSPALGSEGRMSTPPRVWRWETPVGAWTLRTYVDVGSRIRQLSYWHTVGVFGPQPQILTSQTSIGSWLGIEGHDTTWDRLTEADTVDAVVLLTRLCAHFRAAVPDLVAGLSPEGPAGG